MLKYDKSIYFSGFLLYFLSAPFFSWPLLRVTGIKIILYFIFGFICYSKQKKMDNYEKMLVGLFVFSNILYGLTSPNDILIKALLCVSYIPVVFAPFSKGDFFKKVYDVFETCFVVIMAGSILCYIASLSGVLGPLFSMNGLISEFGDKAYDVYGLCVKQNVYDSIRFYGPYDEPGVIGTYAALMLIIDKFNLKSIKCWVLIISGVLSLSLFFFLIIGGYLLFSAIYHKKFLPILLLLFLVPFAYEQTKDDVELQWRLWRRFSITDGEWEGDDRTTDYIDKYYDSKKYSLEYWFGVNDWEHVVNNLGGDSSYKLIVLRNGMVFFGIYCLFFVLYGYKYLKKSRLTYLMFLFVFFSCMYQRTNLYGMLTVYLFCYYARFYNEENYKPQLSKRRTLIETKKQ